MGIVNAGQLGIYDALDPELRAVVEDALLCRRPDAAERLIAFAQTLAERGQGQGSQTAQTALEWRNLPVAERLKHALVKGITEF
ncbi:hypothetical protein, partial [Escherichia coli]